MYVPSIEEGLTPATITCENPAKLDATIDRRSRVFFIGKEIRIL